MWRRRLGARRPSTEEAMAIDDAQAVLRSVDPSLPEAGDVYVLDDPLPASAARGRTVILSRGLLESDAVPAVYAHELGHRRSLDARLTEALERLELWGDPLGPIEPQRGVEATAGGEERSGGLLLGGARWALRLAGGGCAEGLLRPLWAAYWRDREYAADAHAASLGQAEDLARHLTEQELPFDPPPRRSQRLHPQLPRPRLQAVGRLDRAFRQRDPGLSCLRPRPPTATLVIRSGPRHTGRAG